MNKFDWELFNSYIKNTVHSREFTIEEKQKNEELLK